jgi:hypothetical protein
MTKIIALCGVCTEICWALEHHGGCHLLCFGDEPERRGDVKLAYFLGNGLPVDLIVVGYPGAQGLTACDYLRGQSKALPILWLCDRAEFEPEARRLGVGFCRAGPPDTEQTVQIILKTMEMKSFEEEY